MSPTFVIGNLQEGQKGRWEGRKEGQEGQKGQPLSCHARKVSFCHARRLLSGIQCLFFPIIQNALSCPPPLDFL